MYKAEQFSENMHFIILPSYSFLEIIASVLYVVTDSLDWYIITVAFCNYTFKTCHYACFYVCDRSYSSKMLSPRDHLDAVWRLHGPALDELGGLGGVHHLPVHEAHLARAVRDELPGHEVSRVEDPGHELQAVVGRAHRDARHELAVGRRHALARDEHLTHEEVYGHILPTCCCCCC